MRIKKHPDKNEYLLTEHGLWVRDFTKMSVPCHDINKSISQEEYFMLLKNEVKNMQSRAPWIESENLHHENVVIVSDGYDFTRLHQILGDLSSKKVTVMGVNGSLAHWAIPGRNMNYYVVNNPFQECLQYLPRKHVFPKCIASTRTNADFMQHYRGLKFRYAPANPADYSGVVVHDSKYRVDDYRNPICAAINLAAKFGAAKVMLLCCDNTFKDERPGAELLPNGLWLYPQQRIAHSLIDGNLYWLGKTPNRDIQVVYHGSGPQFKNATYIEEEKVCSFFEVDNG